MSFVGLLACTALASGIPSSKSSLDNIGNILLSFSDPKAANQGQVPNALHELLFDGNEYISATTPSNDGVSDFSAQQHVASQNYGSDQAGSADDGGEWYVEPASAGPVQFETAYSQTHLYPEIKPYHWGSEGTDRPAQVQTSGTLPVTGPQYLLSTSYPSSDLTGSTATSSAPQFSGNHIPYSMAPLTPSSAVGYVDPGWDRQWNAIISLGLGRYKMTNDFGPLWRSFQRAIKTSGPKSFFPATLDAMRTQLIREQPYHVALMRDFVREYSDFAENQYGTHLLCGEDLVTMMRKGQIVYLYYLNGMTMAIQHVVLHDPRQPTNLMDKKLKELQPLGFAMMRGYDMTEAGSEELAMDLEVTAAVVQEKLIQALQCYVNNDQMSEYLKSMHDFADDVARPHRLSVCDAAVARQIQERKLSQLPLRTIQYVQIINRYASEIDVASLHGRQRRLTLYSYLGIQDNIWENYAQAMVYAAEHQAELALFYRQKDSHVMELITLYHPRHPTLDGEAKIRQLKNIGDINISTYDFTIGGRVAYFLDLQTFAASASGSGSEAMSPSLAAKWDELAYIRYLYDPVAFLNAEDSSSSESEVLETAQSQPQPQPGKRARKQPTAKRGRPRKRRRRQNPQHKGQEAQ
ncbi:hypothetical protein H4R34_000983 [Dimargaris verticillata]|uniref:Uncharacterized protein n=1 Tax=Dimargaris verticillata TaxID=2761393 RepID=A0A9W8BAV0_9FUNG|nr:hypothetical protein H4R34_000983 [Dimargaris verticillata]